MTIFLTRFLARIGRSTLSKDKTDPPEEAVGYKRPPRRTQFKPGQSGNPQGRPRKTETVAEVFSRQLNKKIELNDGGKMQTMTLLEAIAMQHTRKAAKGDVKSTRLVLEIVKALLNTQDNNLPELINQFQALHASREAAERARPRPPDDDEPDDDPEKE